MSNQGRDMKILVIACRMAAPFVFALASCLASAAPTGCPGNYARGEAPEILNDAIKVQAHELCFSAFGLMHSGISRTAVWSAEHLTRENIQSARKQRREDDFHEELTLPAADRSLLNDYRGSGLDRGHLTPSADAPNAVAQRETFSLSNMVPQSAELNRGLWSGLESAVRNMALQDGELYVITGPFFLGQHITKIHNHVMVPTNIFKLVYDPRSQQAGVYLVKNQPGEQYEVISVAELEKISGIDFMPGMDTNLKRHAMDLPPPLMHGPNHNEGSGPGLFSAKPLSNLLHLLR
jgi:endonuclease G